MPIQVLSREISEKIAAGEVVDRPASVVKELTENSIDSGATNITVEITSNGLKSIRVIDNGSGIKSGEIKTAFLRHATSKVCKEDDLYSIKTLGFRGEALAAIAAVSKISLITRSEDEKTAHIYKIDGGENKDFSQIGRDIGTTVIVEDIFYNTPARMKFLKKDASEGNAVGTLLTQLALSHPEISFKFVRENKNIFTSPGNGDLYSAIYSVLPREIAASLIKLEKAESISGITVEGYISKPEYSRKSRVHQYIFINNRYVKCSTVTAAVETSYRNMNMTGKFPIFVININMPFENVDVNVHPAKTEVRFSNDQEVFNAVYRACFYTLASLSGNVLEALDSKRKEKEREVAKEEVSKNNTSIELSNTKSEPQKVLLDNINVFFNEKTVIDTEDLLPKRRVNLDIDPEADEKFEEKESKNISSFLEEQPKLKVIGELFTIYILAEYEDSFILIDKHAAHERILFEEIMNIDIHNSRQVLIEPEIIVVSPDEKDLLIENSELLLSLGFSIDEFGVNEIAIREVPTYFKNRSVKEAVEDISVQLQKGIADPKSEDTVWLLHSLSCKAAIRAGHKTTNEELIYLTEKILCETIPKYCPHGRQVYTTLSKQEIDKRFGRT